MTTPVDSPDRDGARDPPALRLITHDGLGRLDRWTLAPADASEGEWTTTWMSVEPSVVVELEERR